MLPFVHAVELEKSIISESYDLILANIYPVLIYSLIITSLAIILFLRQMKKR